MGWFDRKEKAGDTETAAPSTANTNMNLGEVEEFDVVADDLRQSIAKIKGRTTAVKAVKAAVSVLYPTSAAIAADDRRKETARKKAEEEALKNPTPGKEIAGEGVFLGQFRPKGRDGKSLGVVFNAFAAPEDLTDTSGKKESFKYLDAVKRVKALKDFHGHDGESYATDKELNQALKSGTYKGGWIIPTRELLIGTEADGPTGIRKGGVVQPDNLFDHKDKGVLKDTFCLSAASGSGCPQWYWSCTEYREYPAFVWIADFSDGYVVWNLKDNDRLSCRLVRLVPVPGAG